MWKILMASLCLIGLLATPAMATSNMDNPDRPMVRQGDNNGNMETAPAREADEGQECDPTYEDICITEGSPLGEIQAKTQEANEDSECDTTFGDSCT